MKIICIALIVLLGCQLFKLFYFSLKDKKIKIKNFFTDGGMPSAHAAFSTSVTTLFFLEGGKESRFFVISLAFTLIVLNDSIKVRRAVGLQARTLNKVIEVVDTGTMVRHDERNGHKLIEVLVGIVVGIVGSAALYHIKL